MVDGTVEELYKVVPEELHKQMETYQVFKTVVSLNSNLLDNMSSKLL